MAFFLRLSVVAIVLVLAACATPPSPKTGAATFDAAPAAAQQTTDAGKTAAIGDAGTQAASTAPVQKISLVDAGGAASDGVDYHIAPLDMLEVTVFQVPDLSKTVQVSTSGKVTLPLIGAVAASGKTTGQLEDEIATLLGAKYLQSPDVSVFVKDAVSQRITVEGAVNKPGVYPTTGPTTLMQVIALAGGLDRIADTKGIVVFRKVDGKRQAAIFDYKAIRAGTIDDPVIAGGDVVVVDESGMKSTLRNVRESIGVFGLFMPLLL